MAVVSALVTARLQPRGGLPGNSRWDSGLATLQLRSPLSVASSDFLCLWLPSCDTFPSFSTKQVISLLDKFLNLSN